MKTNWSITVFACCSFVAFGFAQKAESNTKLSMLPTTGLRTTTTEYSESSTAHALERYDEGSSEDSLQWLERRLQNGDFSVQELIIELKEQRAEDYFWQAESASKGIVYEVTNITPEHFMLNAIDAKIGTLWTATVYID